MRPVYADCAINRRVPNSYHHRVCSKLSPPIAFCSLTSGIQAVCRGPLKSLVSEKLWSWYYLFWLICFLLYYLFWLRFTLSFVMFALAGCKWWIRGRCVSSVNFWLSYPTLESAVFSVTQGSTHLPGKSRRNQLPFTTSFCRSIIFFVSELDR